MSEKTVICDKCPMWSWIHRCNLKYSTTRGGNPDAFDFVSTNCRLIKIVTQDGEITPEEVKE